MTSYFKDVNELAEWLNWTSADERRRRSYVRSDQVERAEKAIKQGGRLLSYIKGIKCWAGVFTIAGKELVKSEGDTPWDREFNHYFEVEPVRELRSPAKCFLVRESEIRSGHDGRGIYNHIRDVEACERIYSRIKIVADMSEKEAMAQTAINSEFAEFQRSWDETLRRSSFLSRVAIKRSRGQCDICGVTTHEWIKRIQERLTDSGKWLQTLISIEHIRDDGFEMLQAHHQESVKDGGTTELDNLVALCPNCHSLVHLAQRHP